MERRKGPTLGTIVVVVAVTAFVVTRPDTVLSALANLITAAQRATDSADSKWNRPELFPSTQDLTAPVDSEVHQAEDGDPIVPAFVPTPPIIPYTPPRISFHVASGSPFDLSGNPVQSNTRLGITNTQSVSLEVTIDPASDSRFVLFDQNGRKVPFIHTSATQPITSLDVNGLGRNARITVPLPTDVTEGRLEFRGQLLDAISTEPSTRRDSPRSSALTLMIDRVGPRLRSVMYDDTRKGTAAATILVTLVDDDLAATAAGSSGTPPEPDPTAGNNVDETLSATGPTADNDLVKAALNVGSGTPTFSAGRITLRRHDVDLDRSENVGGYTVHVDPARPDRFFLDFSGSLTAGEYVLSLTEGINPAHRIKDLVGNPAGTFAGPGGLVEGEAQSDSFVVFPQGETGQHVAFPLFTPPKVGDREQPFNPNDFVVTRVARLYYQRDGHRVAQIINRNVRSYNRAAVTQAERAAEGARELANELVDERRAAERAAVRSSEQLRRLEDDLQTAQTELDGRALTDQQLQEVKDQIARNDGDIGVLDSQIRTIDGRIQALGTPVTEEQSLVLMRLREERAELDEQRALLQRERTERTGLQADLQRRLDARSASAIQGDISTLQSQISAQQQRMLDVQETAEVAQAKEDRQAEVAFRKEVAAANEDPDTYVPGDIDSVDPVTQVSVSVIGEGLIQLRGPIQGVNKIRTMINQIDSPLGQVKVGIFTVQVNGERGERMERVARRIEGHVDLSRFLTSHSLMLMRRSVQEVASEVAAACAEFEGHTQIDRDRRYLYAFFGRDFVDSLFSMNSEFLFTGNRLLSLNSMDNISLNRALFVLALARNDIRMQIIERFLSHVTCDLPQAEYDYRIATRLDKPGKHLMKTVHTEVMNRYIFRNFRSVFESELIGADTLNPMQLEFLRLAQIFKSQMVAEVELKQRIVERGLIQDRSNDETQQAEILADVQAELRRKVKEQLLQIVEDRAKYQDGIRTAQSILNDYIESAKLASIANEARQSAVQASAIFNDLSIDKKVKELRKATGNSSITSHSITSESANDYVNNTMNGMRLTSELLPRIRDAIAEMSTLEGTLKPDELANLEAAKEAMNRAEGQRSRDPARTLQILDRLSESALYLNKLTMSVIPRVRNLNEHLQSFQLSLSKTTANLSGVIGNALKNSSGHGTDLADQRRLFSEYSLLVSIIRSTLGEGPRAAQIRAAVDNAFQSVQGSFDAVENLTRSTQLKDATRQQLDHRKLLDHLITEKEEKHIELVEGTRAYTATMDAYLKRLVVALEDDCRIQFYDPAFERIRGAAREYDVQLGQVERTTILTNNRELAKVEPTATMEFDLPKRDIVITEAMKGAKALVQDYGALLQDPTFLAATDLLSGSPPTAAYNGSRPGVPGLPNTGYMTPLVKDTLPPLPTSTPQQLFNLYGKPQPELGANLAALIPDPAVYKFETGTGFEIRPVIQPDGDSIIYNFNYMYTTNVREPVRPDEKHLGRVKRHFINTEVQTSTYELREISRYTVALKASRTSRGVPLFEDIPGLGILFRPLPSDESSLQQNIILGQSTVYPTLFDLMGLRWAPYVVDLDDVHLQQEEFVVRGRRKIIENWTFDESSGRVDSFLRVPDHPGLYRPDLYRIPDRPSPHHPNGYDLPSPIVLPGGRPEPMVDPRGRDFVVPDPRPVEYRRPHFDERTGRLTREPDPVPHVSDGMLELLPGTMDGLPELPPTMSIEPGLPYESGGSIVTPHSSNNQQPPINNPFPPTNVPAPANATPFVNPVPVEAPPHPGFPEHEVDELVPQPELTPLQSQTDVSQPVRPGSRLDERTRGTRIDTRAESTSPSRLPVRDEQAARASLLQQASDRFVGDNSNGGSVDERRSILQSLRDRWRR